MPDWLLKDSRPENKVLHPTTELALEALKTLAQEGFAPGRVLDVGCGSGLLTLAACGLWPGAAVTACDISAQAVADCGENLAAAGISERVQLVRSDALGHPQVLAGGPYDLVLANLLADILIVAAREVERATAPGGVAVLSGILSWQRPAVAEAYAATRLELAGEIAAEPWLALVFRVSSSLS